MADEMDGTQKVTEAVRKVFSVDDIPVLTNTVGKRWVRIPEWGDSEVCVWGTRLTDRARIESDAAQAGDKPTQAAIRRQIAAVIECTRDGDGPDAARIFERARDWGWLERQPASALDAIYAAVRDLDASGATTQAVEDLFGLPEIRTEIEQLKSCLSYIASVSGCCTDCPQNSQGTCPLRSSTQPSPQTES